MVHSVVTLLFISNLCIPSQQNCDIRFEGIDLSTKKYRVEMVPAYFFSYTPVEIKNDLLTENLITTTAQLTQIEDDIQLRLRVEVASKQARSVYGGISAGSVLVITLINEDELRLQCEVGSQGRFNDLETGFIYEMSYALDRRSIKKLQKAEIDKLALQWTSGLEEYTIYEVDLLLNQLTCLQSVTRPN
ncbi:MAG: hypothetical protein AAFQ02_08000 [Bacteroidota bacterium]